MFKKLTIDHFNQVNEVKDKDIKDLMFLDDSTLVTNQNILYKIYGDFSEKVLGIYIGDESVYDSLATKADIKLHEVIIKKNKYYVITKDNISAAILDYGKDFAINDCVGNKSTFKYLESTFQNISKINKTIEVRLLF